MCIYIVHYSKIKLYAIKTEQQKPIKQYDWFGDTYKIFLTLTIPSRNIQDKHILIFTGYIHCSHIVFMEAHLGKEIEVDNYDLFELTREYLWNCCFSYINIVTHI